MFRLFRLSLNLGKCPKVMNRFHYWLIKLICRSYRARQDHLLDTWDSGWYTILCHPVCVGGGQSMLFWIENIHLQYKSVGRTKLNVHQKKKRGGGVLRGGGEILQYWGENIHFSIHEKKKINTWGWIQLHYATCMYFVQVVQIIAMAWWVILSNRRLLVRTGNSSQSNRCSRVIYIYIYVYSDPKYTIPHFLRITIIFLFITP